MKKTNIYVGEIYQLKTGAKKPLLVLSLKKNTAYCVWVSSFGEINHENRVFCYDVSDLLDGEKAELKSRRDLKRVSVHTLGDSYSWYLLNSKLESPEERSVNEQMSQLDDRYRLFINTCSDRERELFNQHESVNNHHHNNIYISLYTQMYLIKNEVY